MKPISLIFLLFFFFFSCKKKEEAGPSPMAVNDVYEMYDPDTVKLCPVMENDLFFGKATVFNTSYILPYGLFESVDSSILFAPYKNAYGSFYCNYTLYAQNGTGTARVTVKRGTNEQIITSTLIGQFTNYYSSAITDRQYYLYAIDDDTSYFYKNTNYNEWVRFESTKEIAISSSYLPNIRRNYPEDYYPNKANYSIDIDGIIHAIDNSENEVSIKMLGTFSDIAKKPDNSGYVQVKGFTLGYNGKKYDFAMVYQ